MSATSTTDAATIEVRALSARYDVEGVDDIDVYEQHGGYEGLRRALTMEPGDIIQLVKDSGLRGRGGAGFPTGLKWSFVAQGTGKPVYVVCNADESEPGTFKDRPLMERDPHSLIEGMIVAGLALNSEQGYIYLRGEFGFASRQLSAAIRQAYAKGYLGADVMGSGKRYDLLLHRGAAAYICGEETALLDSLEGRRGQPRLRPPFPAVQGLFGCPTTVNNVESIATVPHLLVNGPDWFTQWGTEKSPGTKLMCISGEVKRPGNYEVPMGVTVRQLIDLAGGMLDGRELKFFCPGGSSTPILPASAIDTPYTYEDIAAAGSLLGTGALMLYSDATSVVSVVRRFTEFYEHESCGKCTPCREGGYWASQVLDRIEGGAGVMEDLETLERLCDSIFGRSFCALGDALTSPIASSLKHFRDEYVDLIQRGVGPTGAAPARDVPRMEPATVSGTARYRAELAALAASAVATDDLPAADVAEVDA